MARKSSFGSIRKLPSGHYQARYTGPDGRIHKAHTTFETKRDAEIWLSTVRADIVRETWRPDAAPKISMLTFGAYAEAWMRSRKVKGRPLADRTREHYQALLDDHILPTFKDAPLRYITPEAVEAWYETTAVNAPTLRAHAYSLLRTILNTATSPTGPLRGQANPAAIRGAGNVTRAKEPRAATLEELATIVEAVPERYRLMVQLAAWCALRFGELAELRRTDVDTRRGVLHIRRGVVRAEKRVVIKTTKSDHERTVTIPPHLLDDVRAHLLKHAASGADGLMFPGRNGEHMAPSALYRVFYPARAKAGRPDLRFHDLRGTGAVLAAQTGATLAEVMSRLGHSTPQAAMRYQSVASGRDAEIARRLSAMARGTSSGS